MKPFTLFFGGNQQIGTFDVTSDPSRYQLATHSS